VFVDKGVIMKHLLVIAVSLALTACGTVGGAISGAGQDLSKAGEWVRNR
jgi:predicted small secreted protein